MNEFYLLAQIITVLLFCYGAFRIGKTALTSAITVQAILANFFVLKQVIFFGFEVTCSDAFAIGSILCLNLLREYFGKEAATKAITSCFFFMTFFVVVSQMHLRFLPGPADTSQFAYARILSSTPRLLFASLIVFFLIQHFDIRLFGWISRLFPSSYFTFRSSLSLLCSQLIDTILFSIFGLYGLVNSIVPIILISFLLKASLILILSPLMSLFKRFESHV